jgi:hypothetical protein
MAGPITIPVEFPKYGAVYGEEISNVEADLSGGGLDLKGMVGDDIEIGVFFDYANLTGYTFSAFVVLDPPPLKRSFTITVTPLDLTVGFISVKLSSADSTTIGPVADKPWFLKWSVGGKTRTILMGKLYLNRMY